MWCGASKHDPIFAARFRYPKEALPIVSTASISMSPRPGRTLEAWFPADTARRRGAPFRVRTSLLLARDPGVRRSESCRGAHPKPPLTRQYRHFSLLPRQS